MSLLETPRLLLRGVTYDDVPHYMTYVNRADYMRFMVTDEMQEHDVVAMLQNESRLKDYWRLALLLKEDKRFIGDVVLQRSSTKNTALIGYGMNPDYWSQGYMTEAVRFVTTWGYDVHHLHRIEATCHADNAASWHLLEKAGYIRENSLTLSGWKKVDDVSTLYFYASTRPKDAPFNQHHGF